MNVIKINNQAEELTFKKCFDKWLKYCRANNYAKATINYYNNTIHVFTMFFDQNQLVSEIDTSLLQDYIIFLQDRGVNDTTIKTYIGGLRTVLYFFMENGWMEKYKVKVPKAESKIKAIYTDEELSKLLKKPNLKKCLFTEYRNWVLVNYLLGTAQRETTVVNIKIKDVDLYNCIVRLEKTKNKKQTLLPLSASLVNILDEYLTIRKGEDEDYLFCNQFGEQMTTSALISAIRSYNRRRGVYKTSVHLFRHTFATKWVRQNNDIVKLQHLMCHSDIKTTQKYLNLSLADLQEGYEEMNPLETLIGKNKEKIKIKK